MADTQQGVRHQSARDAAGTVDTYDGDLRALFNAVATVPAGSTFNEAFMLWLQSVTGSSADNINDLAALYASQQDDTYNWSSGGPLLGGDLPVLFDWDIGAGDPYPIATDPGYVFTRASTPDVSTTADNTTFFDQTVRVDEIALNKMRRGANDLADDLLEGWTANNGASINLGFNQLTFPGSAGTESATIGVSIAASRSYGFLITMSSSVSGDIDLVLTGSAGAIGSATQTITAATASQSYWVAFENTGTSGTVTVEILNTNSVGTVLTVTRTMVCHVQSAISSPEDFVQASVDHGWNVSGVKYFGTTNGNSVLNGVVIFGAGVAVPDGGLTNFAVTTFQSGQSITASQTVFAELVVDDDSVNQTIVDSTGLAYPLRALFGGGTPNIRSSVSGSLQTLFGVGVAGQKFRTSFSYENAVGGGVILSATNENSATGVTNFEDTGTFTWGVTNSQTEPFTGGRINRITIYGVAVDQAANEELVAFPP